MVQPHYQVQNPLVQTGAPQTQQRSSISQDPQMALQNTKERSSSRAATPEKIGGIERLKMGVLATLGGAASIVTAPLTVGLGAIFFVGFGVGEFISQEDRRLGSFIKDSSALLGFGAIALPYCAYKAFESAYFGEKINILD